MDPPPFNPDNPEHLFHDYPADVRNATGNEGFIGLPLASDHGQAHQGPGNYYFGIPPNHDHQNSNQAVPDFIRAKKHQQTVQKPGEPRMTYDHLQMILQVAKEKMPDMYADIENPMVISLHQDLDRAIADCAQRLSAAQDIYHVAISNSHSIVKAFAITNLCKSGQVFNSVNIFRIANQKLKLPVELAAEEINATMFDDSTVNDALPDAYGFGDNPNVPRSPPFDTVGEFSEHNASSGNASSRITRPGNNSPNETRPFVAVDPSQSKKKDKRVIKTVKYNRLNPHLQDNLIHAPSANIPFPLYNGTPANVTAVELLTFFPRYLKSTDVIERLVSNGVSSRVLTTIINAHRDTVAPTYDMYFFNIMTSRMRAKGDKTTTVGVDYSKWVPSGHQALDNHDPNSLDISGFRTDEQISAATKTLIRTNETDYNSTPIPFKRLAEHVKRFPSGNDALNLTRCVEHARDHPDELWMYPGDFERLVAHVSHGAPFGRVPTAEHFDAAAFRRWRKLPAAFRVQAQPTQQSQGHATQEPQGHFMHQFQVQPNHQFQGAPNQQFQDAPIQQFQGAPIQQLQAAPTQQLPAHMQQFQDFDQSFDASQTFDTSPEFNDLFGDLDDPFEDEPPRKRMRGEP